MKAIGKRSGLKMIVIVKDEDWKTIAKFKFNVKDEKTKSMVVRTLKDKYNISLKPTVDRDMDWLKGGTF